MTMKREILDMKNKYFIEGSNVAALKKIFLSKTVPSQHMSTQTQIPVSVCLAVGLSQNLTHDNFRQY